MFTPVPSRVEALARFAEQTAAGLIPGCPSFSWLASTVRVPLNSKIKIDTRLGVYFRWCAKRDSTACSLRSHASSLASHTSAFGPLTIHLSTGQSHLRSRPLGFESFKLLKNEKRWVKPIFLSLVRHKGLEPLTFAFVVRYSIQLS